MNSWKDVNVNGIVSIQKCVAEFDINQFDVPNGKFKIRIYEEQDRVYYYGYTNLKIKNPVDGIEGGVGYGDSIEKTLKNTLENFMELMRDRDNLSEDDFVFVPYEFF